MKNFIHWFLLLCGALFVSCFVPVLFPAATNIAFSIGRVHFSYWLLTLIGLFFIAMWVKIKKGR